MSRKIQKRPYGLGFNGRLGLGLCASQLGLALSNLLVELVVVARGQVLFRLLGLGPLCLLILVTINRLALLANIGLLLLGLNRLGHFRALGDNVRLSIHPQLAVLVDGQRHRLRALDKDGADAILLLGHVLVGYLVGNLDNVLRNRLGVLASQAHLDGGVGGGRQVNERASKRLFNLSGHLSHGPAVDVVGIALDLLAILLTCGLLGKDDGYGPLGSRLVEALAEGLGKAVDDAVVGQKDVVLGGELALGLVLLKLGRQVLEVDDARYALAQGVGEGVVGDEVLVVALGIRDNKADGGLVAFAALDWVWQRNLGWLQLLGVMDVALGRNGQPDGRLGEREDLVVVIVVGYVENVLLGRVGGGLGGSLLDVCQESLGGLERLLGGELLLVIGFLHYGCTRK